MNSYCKIFFLLITYSLVLFAQDCKSIVKITVDDYESEIFIDSTIWGKGKVNTELSTGKYKLKILQSEREWGSGVIIDSISVAECGKEYSFNYSFDKKKLVLTEPEDAEVIKEDSLIGFTPLKVSSGSNKLTLSKNGYQTITLTTVNNYEKVKLDFNGIKKEEPFTHTILFKVLIGSAVALGTTAAYLKLEADKKFDKYLETRQSNYLDDTDRLDLYSGLAFGALQINFGALLYFFLME